MKNTLKLFHFFTLTTNIKWHGVIKKMKGLEPYFSFRWL
jgi:hypothetical protein